MLTFSKRFYKSVYRFPYPGENEGFKPKRALVYSIIMTAGIGYIMFKIIKKSENSRKKFAEDYKPVIPEDVVPKMENIKRIDENKLRQAIIEGDKFIFEEMQKNVAKSPGDFALIHTKKLKDQDKQKFIMFVHRGILQSMARSGVNFKELQKKAYEEFNRINKKG